MKRTLIGIPEETNKKLQDFCLTYPIFQKQMLCGKAIEWYIQYFAKHQRLPSIDIINNNSLDTTINNDITKELVNLASDLDGMTENVIKSHLVRFPKVTLDDYKGIIDELHVRQNSEDGLKNPEAAAYGLCKRIQNSQLRTTTTPQEQHQEPPTTVPDDNPFAIYEP